MISPIETHITHTIFTPDQTHITHKRVSFVSYTKFINSQTHMGKNGFFSHITCFTSFFLESVSYVSYNRILRMRREKHTHTHIIGGGGQTHKTHKTHTTPDLPSRSGRVSPPTPHILAGGIAAACLPMSALAEERTIARVPRVTPDQCAPTWVELAHAAGKPVHIGMVGTVRNYLRAAAIGADSVDGAGPMRNENLDEISRFRRLAAEQTCLSQEVRA